MLLLLALARGTPKTDAPDTNDTEDSGLPCAAWWPDADGDGFGDAAVASACDEGDGYVDNGDDCDDGDATRNPGAVDSCDDDVDSDCDGVERACRHAGTVDLGSTDVELASGRNNFDAGRRVDIGDVTGDGYGDLLLATLYAEGYGGGGFLVPGPITTSRTLDAADFRIDGDANLTFGASRSIAMGDVNGDGVGDVALGAPYGIDTNGLFVLLGPITGDRVLADAEVVLRGPQVSYAGHGGALADVNGDGIADGVVGCYAGSLGGGDSGTVFVEYGPLSGEVDLEVDADATLVGEGASWYTGRTLHAGGDVDGDGLADIVIAAIYGDGGAPQSGVVYVVLGAPMGEMGLGSADARLLGELPGDYAGLSVETGDVDGDGYADVLAGANGGAEAGRVYVVRGPVTGEVSLGTAAAILDGTAGS
ncbi:MAG: VCBS repeat-containing protein [Myxococcota bacterium]